MREDHQEDQDSALSHELEAEQIKRLQPFYQQRLPYILRSFASLIYHNIILIAESQIINRTVFALQKLQLLNPNFFTPQENQILSPLPSGIVSYTLQFTCSAMNAIYGLYLYKTWSFNAKSLGLWAVFLATQQVCVQYPNFYAKLLFNSPEEKDWQNNILKFMVQVISTKQPTQDSAFTNQKHQKYSMRDKQILIKIISFNFIIVPIYCILFLSSLMGISLNFIQNLYLVFQQCNFLYQEILKVKNLLLKKNIYFACPFILDDLL